VITNDFKNLLTHQITVRNEIYADGSITDKKKAIKILVNDPGIPFANLKERYAQANNN
jgi:anti-sigma regulatory factor (Ser/Thr protein kinase)